MNRIDAKFIDLRSAGDKGIIAYVTAGDPDLETTEKLVCRLAEGGVAMVELGVPFSDPVADGPVIQAAAGRALENGVTLADVLELTSRLRTRLDIPLLVMTYYNPVYSFGLEPFVHSASKSGLDGVIVPDLPLEESEELSKMLQQSGLHLIHLLAPTSSPGRIKATVKNGSGFIYCVSVSGVTGARNDLPASGNELLSRVRTETDLPLALGFGISRPEQVSALGDKADAVIIGSAIVRLAEEGGDRDEILERVASYVKKFN
ncbi:MAG: tryptophan synthase subunit alpha [Bacillota bacterium]